MVNSAPLGQQMPCRQDGCPNFRVRWARTRDIPPGRGSPGDWRVFQPTSATGGQWAGHLLPATLESTPQAVLAPGARTVHNAPMLNICFVSDLCYLTILTCAGIVRNAPTLSLLMINICFVLYLVIPGT